MAKQQPPALLTSSGAVLSHAAHKVWAEAQAILRAPLIVNDSAGARNHRWFNRSEEWQELLKKTLEKTQGAQAPGVVAFLHENGEILSVAARAKILKTTPAALYGPLAKAGAIDPREQARWECLLEDWARETRHAPRAFIGGAWERAHQQPPSWGQLKVSDAQAWGRLLTGREMAISASEGRELAKRWIPSLAAQHPQDAAGIVKGAIAWALAAAKAPLPKASSPTALTPEQTALARFVEHCGALAVLAEKALKAAGKPTPRSEIEPRELVEMRAAFEAKARRLEENKSLKAKGELEGDEASEAPAAQGLWAPRLENGRRKMAKIAAGELDVEALEWIAAQSPDGGRWMGEPAAGGELLSAAVAQVYSVQRGKNDASVKALASERGNHVIATLIRHGLNLLEEARASGLQTDNPFLRLATLCVGDQTGVVSGRLASEMTRQMREARLDLPDAEAFFNETLADRLFVHDEEGKAAFRRVALASLERWQLNAELERAGGEAASAAAEGPAPKAPAPRRSARL